MRTKLTLGFAAFTLASLAAAQMDMSRYGGPTYSGAPALTVTASLVKAGGGPDHFSTAQALTSMVGADTVTAEVNKLTAQFGKDRVDTWLQVFDFAVGDALGKATAAGVHLPDATLSGVELAKTLVIAGKASGGQIYTELLLDKAVSHKIHVAVMDDIDAKFGEKADMDYHMITNQALFDLGKALHVRGVKLAPIM